MESAPYFEAMVWRKATGFGWERTGCGMSANMIYKVSIPISGSAENSIDSMFEEMPR